MQTNILTEQQHKLLPLIKLFNQDFGLVGGTAIALYLGHRQSIDFDFQNIINLPDLLTLGAMKAFALGKRAKWKDYVDLYFLLKKYSLSDLNHQANTLFGSEFNEKLFRVQLAYFKDIDYSEEVKFMPSFEIASKKICEYLEKVSLD